jgi:RNA polymerase sigma-70 factor (ECF subfamily)
MTIQEYNQCVYDYSDALFRFIQKNLKDQMEAENVVQNTFEKLWMRREDVVYETARPFIFKLGYNNMIDLIRKRKHEVAMDAVPEKHYWENQPAAGLKEALNKALNRLPEKLKTVVLLRDYEGHDYRTIGTITGMSEAQVKINIFRARKALKEYIGSIESVM